MLTETHSRQIRPPIYSMKQTKLRRRRVIRYSILYFTLFIVFMALIIGPAVAGKFVPESVFNMLKSTNLVQPSGLNNDDTRGRTPTGTGAPGYKGVYTPSTTSTFRATATSRAGADRMMLLV